MTERPQLWASTEVGEVTGTAASGDWRATGVAIDSRTLQPGDLFVAIRGPRVDGHAFVADAFERGAAAAIVSQRPDGVASDRPLVLVEDTLAALGDLARRARRRAAARIIGVTGSVGKTGVKEALRTVLSDQAPTAANDGSLNNHWGLPLSLARLPADFAYGVFEMGMNHPGEIDALTRLARPHVAVITTIAPAHMAFFPSLDAIADAKAEIFTGVPAGGAAVLNRDIPQFTRLARAAAAAGLERVVSFGRDAAADVRLIESAIGESGADVRAEVAGTVRDYRLELPGTHWIINSLSVLAAVVAAGADDNAAARALSRVRSPKRRGERFNVSLAGGDVFVIDDSYNANPASMAAAIEVLGQSRPGPGGRRVAVLGDMLELGRDAAAMHAGLAGPLEMGRIDVVFTAGAEMARLFDALPASRRGHHAATSADLIAPLVAALSPGDVVLVKGSAGSRMGAVVAALRDASSAPLTPTPGAAA
jgi:UDP-N-acetylmuramoyl-tripeptide--D-alanyl-D-alanine ligase